MANTHQYTPMQHFRLTLVISVQCLKGYYGQFCNMTNCTTYDNNTQVCTSSLYPSQSLICHYDNNLMQPVNCTMCAYGVSDGQCRSEDSFYRTERAVSFISAWSLISKDQARIAHTIINHCTKALIRY